MSRFGYDSWPRLPLPATPSAWESGVFWRPTDAFVTELAKHLGNRRVLEIFSGNGYLAAWLRRHGVAIEPTTRFAGHDSHERGLYCEVKELEASQAVIELGKACDVLLMSWPTATEAAVNAALQWGPNRPIVFIGEVTDYAKNQLGGCASDAFFAAIDVTHRFESYRGNSMEQAFECQLKPAPELFSAVEEARLRTHMQLYGHVGASD